MSVFYACMYVRIEDDVQLSVASYIAVYKYPCQASYVGLRRFVAMCACRYIAQFYGQV